MDSREHHSGRQVAAFVTGPGPGPAGGRALRRRPSRTIGIWQGTGELLVHGTSVGRVRYSIEAREDWLGVRSGGGVLTGDDEVIARAFGQPEAELLIESGDTIRIAVTEIRGKLRTAKADVPPWQYLRSWR